MQIFCFNLEGSGEYDEIQLEFRSRRRTNTTKKMFSFNSKEHILPLFMN